MIQSHTRTVSWLSIVHLPHMATVRWLPSRSTTHNNIARLPWSDINVRWRLVMTVLQIRSETRVTRFMESLPSSWIPLARRKQCDENQKPPSLFIPLVVPLLRSRFRPPLFRHCYVSLWRHNSIITQVICIPENMLYDHVSIQLHSLESRLTLSNPPYKITSFTD